MMECKGLSFSGKFAYLKQYLILMEKKKLFMTYGNDMKFKFQCP